MDSRPKLSLPVFEGQHVQEAALAGADIATIPATVFETDHPLTG